jgi:hypothetical protein
MYRKATYSELNFTSTAYKHANFLKNKEAIDSLFIFCNHGSVHATKFCQLHSKKKQMNENLLFSSVLLILLLSWQNDLSCKLICTKECFVTY